MLKQFPVLIAVAAMSVAFANAQGSKLTVPVKHTPANNGKQMYVDYCASCHGLDGRGQGPTAGALKVTPSDLTLLSKNNNGSYPELHVVAVLKFGIENSAHGSQAMPVWGPALNNLDHQVGGTSEAQALRIANLVKYVENLQAK